MPPSPAPPASSLPVLSFGSASHTLDSLTLPPFSHALAATTLSSTTTLNVDPSQPVDIDLAHLVSTVLKAKRIVVVCGAGISCASGIPDFRSSEGLFETLKRQHPTARLSSGKDLFDASLFSSEANAAIFYTMIASLKTMADDAEPTAFHRFLKMLDDEGKLFRVYTQNIDGLEEKAGLSYGLGASPAPSLPSQSPRKGTPSTRSRSSTPPTNTSAAAASTSGTATPRCIPLHGVLSHLYCPHCSHSLPINPHLPLLSTGQTLPCPRCVAQQEARATLGERSRGVGWLKPKVVLYGETHPEGERVGEITRKDLMGLRPDLLLVVGTSLKVPGTKLLVRELAKVIRPPPAKEKKDDEDEALEMPPSSAQSAASSSCGTRKPAAPKPPKVHSIYLNFDFPTPSREFRDTFDVWARGDVQEFVGALETEKAARKDREARRERERKEREDRRVAKEQGLPLPPSKKRPSPSISQPAAAKKAKRTPSPPFHIPILAAPSAPLPPPPPKIKPSYLYVDSSQPAPKAFIAPSLIEPLPPRGAKTRAVQVGYSESSSRKAVTALEGLGQKGSFVSGVTKVVKSAGAPAKMMEAGGVNVDGSVVDGGRRGGLGFGSTKATLGGRSVKARK